jgi:hypothetical protein
MEPAEPTGRSPARRRACAITALTGIAVLLHAALLSELRWMWPTPPAPFGTLEVRALAVPSAPGSVIGAEPKPGIGGDARIENATAAVARDGDDEGTASRRLAEAKLAAEAAGDSAAPKPSVPLAAREGSRRGKLTAGDVVAKAASVDRSDLERQSRDASSGGSGASEGPVLATALVAAEGTVPVEIVVGTKSAAAENAISERAAIGALAPDSATLAAAAVAAPKPVAAWSEPDSSAMPGGSVFPVRGPRLRSLAAARTG